jgi:hypothetical protein
MRRFQTRHGRSCDFFAGGIQRNLANNRPFALNITKGDGGIIPAELPPAKVGGSSAGI